MAGRIEDAVAIALLHQLAMLHHGHPVSDFLHRGEVVVSDPPRHHRPTGQDWPGRDEGLSQRESEVLALITQGRTNAEISEITYLSPNTVKSHIRSCYAKIGVTSHTQAVLWGVEHGLNAEVRIVSNWLLPG